MPAGRPRKYETVEQIQRLIDLYFLGCKFKQANGAENILDGLSDEDKQIVVNSDDMFPTVTGLALALNMTRQGLLDYQGRPEFADAIKSAKNRVEAFIEQRLFFQHATGSIFNLKNNFGWRDQQEIKHEGSMNISIAPTDADL